MSDIIKFTKEEIEGDLTGKPISPLEELILKRDIVSLKGANAQMRNIIMKYNDNSIKELSVIIEELDKTKNMKWQGNLNDI